VTILPNYHICRVALGSMCVGVTVWLGWSVVRIAGFQPATRTPLQLGSMCVGVSVWLGWSGVRVVRIAG